MGCGYVVNYVLVSLLTAFFLSALHDAFELYGRPDAWDWDPRNPVSLMFAYPVGHNKSVRRRQNIINPIQLIIILQRYCS